MLGGGLPIRAKLGLLFPHKKRSSAAEYVFLRCPRLRLKMSSLRKARPLRIAGHHPPLSPRSSSLWLRLRVKITLSGFPARSPTSPSVASGRRSGQSLCVEPTLPGHLHPRDRRIRLLVFFVRFFQIHVSVIRGVYTDGQNRQHHPQPAQRLSVPCPVAADRCHRRPDDRIGGRHTQP